MSSASGTAATSAQLSGLEITDFSSGGVLLDGANYALATDLFVGITTSGGNSVGAGNLGYGVELDDAAHDTLSGSVLSANTLVGVEITGSGWTANLTWTATTSAPASPPTAPWPTTTES